MASNEERTVVLTPQTQADLRAVVFALESYLHFNPTGADAATVRGFSGCCQRLRESGLVPSAVTNQSATTTVEAE